MQRKASRRPVPRRSGTEVPDPAPGRKFFQLAIYNPSPSQAEKLHGLRNREALPVWEWYDWEYSTTHWLFRATGKIDLEEDEEVEDLAWHVACLVWDLLEAECPQDAPDVRLALNPGEPDEAVDIVEPYDFPDYAVERDLLWWRRRKGRGRWKTWEGGRVDESWIDC